MRGRVRVTDRGTVDVHTFPSSVDIRQRPRRVEDPLGNHRSPPGATGWLLASAMGPHYTVLELVKNEKYMSFDLRLSSQHQR